MDGEGRTDGDDDQGGDDVGDGGDGEAEGDPLVTLSGAGNMRQAMVTETPKRNTIPSK